MLIKTSNNYLYKKYKIEKRDIKEKEQKLGRMIRDRYIKLYSPAGYLPVGAKFYIGDYEKDKAIIKNNNNQKINFHFTGQLFDYQLEALYGAIKYGCGLIDSKTGTGKSFIIMGIINHFKVPTVIIVPSRKLVEEMYDKIKANSEGNFSIGRFYSNKKELGTDILIITRTSYNNLYKKFLDAEKKLGVKHMPARAEGMLGRRYQLTIVDEADDGLSQTFISAISESDTDYLVGLTGTATRQDLNTNDLVKFYGPYIKGGDYRILPSRFIQLEYKVTKKLEIMLSRMYKNDDGKRNYYGLIDGVEQLEQYRYRMELIIKHIIDTHRLSLFLYTKKDNAKKRAAIFEAKGYEVVFTSGDDGERKQREINETIDNWRERILKGEKKFAIFATYKKMGRGVDIDVIDAVMLYAKVKFHSTVVQAIGRALRKAPFEKHVDIYTVNLSLLRSQMYQQAKTIKNEYKDVFGNVNITRQNLDWFIRMYVDPTWDGEKFDEQFEEKNLDKNENQLSQREIKTINGKKKYLDYNEVEEYISFEDDPF